jgi:CRISPR-associated protein (TIGR03985 family)
MPPFDSTPTPQRLTPFARNSLRQDLPHAVRLWVILTTLYGDVDDLNGQLADRFTYTEWRDGFFTQTQRQDQDEAIYHQRDTIPPLHDSHCRCAKTLTDWLFETLASDRASWCHEFQQLYPMSDQDLDQLLQTGRVHESGAKLDRKSAGRQSLPGGRLFAVTGRQLQNDFAELVERGWLTQGSHNLEFCRVMQFPNQTRTIGGPESLDLREAIGNVIETDAVDLFEHLGQPIRGIQRLFLDIEYIVPGRLSAQVSTWQQQLKTLWQQEIVLPIQLQYRSARLYGDVQNYVVYPVCVRYFQRAPYLFAYGHNPQSPDHPNWYDFRLDRIELLQPLTWADPEVPQALRDRCVTQPPPTPKDVQRCLTSAWGFDIYSASETLLLRFNQYFHAHYVANTERATLLTAIPTKTARRLVQTAALSENQQQMLLNTIAQKPKDIYCRVQYRDNDNNVVMRLRAWGPNVEVILPWTLRLRMAKDLKETWKLYKEME